MRLYLTTNFFDKFRCSDAYHLLEVKSYEELKLIEVYNYFGSFVAICFGFGSLVYHTVIYFREHRRAQNENPKSRSSGGVSTVMGLEVISCGNSDWKEPDGGCRSPNNINNNDMVDSKDIQMHVGEEDMLNSPTQ